VTYDILSILALGIEQDSSYCEKPADYCVVFKGTAAAIQDLVKGEDHVVGKGFNVVDRVRTHPYTPLDWSRTKAERNSDQTSTRTHSAKLGAPAAPIIMFGRAAESRTSVLCGPQVSIHDLGTEQAVTRRHPAVVVRGTDEPAGDMHRKVVRAIEMRESWIAAKTTSPRRNPAIIVPNSGTPDVKFLVPSIGSIRKAVSACPSLAMASGS
jgi:hypothetical protein